MSRKYHFHEVGKGKIYYHLLKTRHRSQSARDNHDAEIAEYKEVSSMWLKAYRKVKELGGRIFRYRKRVTIVSTGSLTLLAILAMLPGDLIHSGDITCADVCVSYVNYTPSYFDIYIPEGLTVGFIPNIERYNLYIYEDRWKEIEEGPFTFKRGQLHQFKIIGEKEPSKTIKWNLKLSDQELDPYWYGIKPSFGLGLSSKRVWQKMYILNEEPFFIGIDLNSIKINKTEKSLQFDGRFNAYAVNNTSIPAGNKYLGLTFNDSVVKDADLWYRDYNSSDVPMHLTGGDFNWLATYSIANYTFNDVYYVTFPNIPNNTDKEFRMKFYFDEKPEFFLIYFGTGSTGLYVTHGTVTTVYNKMMKWELSMGSPASRYGDVMDSYLDNVRQTYSADARYPELSDTTGNVLGDGSAVCNWVENGTVRRKLVCTNTNPSGNFDVYFYKDVQYFDRNTTTSSGNLWAATYLYIEPEGSTTGTLYYGDGTVDGVAAGSDWAYTTDMTESWFSAYPATNGNVSFYSMMYNSTKNVHSECVRTSHTAQFAFYFGYASGDTRKMLDDTLFFRTGSYNQSSTNLNEQIRKLWNETFFPENLTTQAVSGTLNKWSGTTLACDANSTGACEFNFTSPTLPAHDDFMFFEIGTWSSPNELLWYNQTAGNSNTLFLNFSWNSTSGYWEAGNTMPAAICLAGTKILECTNITQICGAGKCDGTEQSGDIYTVTQYDGHTTKHTILVANATSLPPAPPSPIYNYTKIDMYLNGTLNSDVYHQNNTGANITAVLNVTGIVNITSNITNWSNYSALSPLINTSMTISCSVNETYYFANATWEGNSTHNASTKTQHIICWYPSIPVTYRNQDSSTTSPREHGEVILSAQGRATNLDWAILSTNETYYPHLNTWTVSPSYIASINTTAGSGRVAAIYNPDNYYYNSIDHVFYTGYEAGGSCTHREFLTISKDGVNYDDQGIAIDCSGSGFDDTKAHDIWVQNWNSTHSKLWYAGNTGATGGISFIWTTNITNISSYVKHGSAVKAAYGTGFCENEVTYPTSYYNETGGIERIIVTCYNSTGHPTLGISNSTDGGITIPNFTQIIIEGAERYNNYGIMQPRLYVFGHIAIVFYTSINASSVGSVGCHYAFPPEWTTWYECENNPIIEPTGDDNDLHGSDATSLAFVKKNTTLYGVIAGNNLTAAPGNNRHILLVNMTGQWQNITDNNYESPMDMGDTVNTWTESNFTWNFSIVIEQNKKGSVMEEGTTIGWKIYYNSTDGKENVTSIKSFTFIAPLGIIKPKWSGNTTSPSSPVAYSSGQSYQFNVTWTDETAFDKALIEHNFTGTATNYSFTGNDGSEYYYDYTDLSGGSYQWKSYGNDTTNNQNVTDTWIYTVSKASSTSNLLLNGTDGDKAYDYNSAGNFTISVNTAYTTTVKLDSNYTGWAIKSGNTPLENITSPLSSSGYFWNMTGYFEGDENYTSSSETHYFNVTSLCKDLTSDYTLVTDVSATGSCFNILANGVTIDCAGYTITYAFSSTGYAFNCSGYDNLDIKNCDVVQGSSSTSNSHVIDSNGMYNTTITNNTMKTLGSSSHGMNIASGYNITIENNTINTTGSSGRGIYFNTVVDVLVKNNTIYTHGSTAYGLDPESADTSNFTDNKIKTYGIDGHPITTASTTDCNFLNNDFISYGSGAYGFVDSGSSGCNITGGYIQSNQTADYYLNNIQTNNYTDTNFSVSRQILFNDVNSWFNYNNDSTGNIRVKASPSVASIITRKLINWNTTLLQWNETNTTGSEVTLTYNITGLNVSTSYNIYNNSVLVDTSTTDSTGKLPSFNIYLSSEHEIKIIAVDFDFNVTLPTGTSEWKLNVSSCTGNCYQSGTYQPLNQSGITPFFTPGNNGSASGSIKCCLDDYLKVNNSNVDEHYFTKGSLAQSFNFKYDFNLTKIAIKISNSAGNINVSIQYDNGTNSLGEGAPNGTKISELNNIAVSVGWNVLDIPDIEITKLTDYWIVVKNTSSAATKWEVNWLVNYYNRGHAKWNDTYGGTPGWKYVEDDSDSDFLFYLYTGSPNCMTWYLSTNNTLETSVDMNITTDICSISNETVVSNLAVGTVEELWSFLVFDSCEPGLRYEPDFWFEEV